MINVTATGSLTRDEQMIHALKNSRVIHHTGNMQNEFETELFFEKCYPELFPYGQGGMIETKLKPFLQHCVKFHDQRFVSHWSFIFHGANMLQRWKLCNQAKIRVKSGNAKRTNRLISQVTSKDFDALVKDMKNKVPLKDVNMTPATRALLAEMTCVGGPIPGTPQSLIYRRNEIRSIIALRGIPAFWVTLNPGDVHSPIAIKIHGKDFNMDDIVGLLNVPESSQRHIDIENDSYAAALSFYKVMTAYFECLIRPGKRGILGYVNSYFGMVEEQFRGTLHAHILLWVDGIESIDVLSEKIRIDATFRSLIAAYMDATMCATREVLPEECKDHISLVYNSSYPVSMHRPLKSSHELFELGV